MTDYIDRIKEWCSELDVDPKDYIRLYKRTVNETKDKTFALDTVAYELKTVKATGQRKVIFHVLSSSVSEVRKWDRSTNQPLPPEKEGRGLILWSLDEDEIEWGVGTIKAEGPLAKRLAKLERGKSYSTSASLSLGRDGSFASIRIVGNTNISERTEVPSEEEREALLNDIPRYTLSDICDMTKDDFPVFGRFDGRVIGADIRGQRKTLLASDSSVDPMSEITHIEIEMDKKEDALVDKFSPITVIGWITLSESRHVPRVSAYLCDISEKKGKKSKDAEQGKKESKGRKKPKREEEKEEEEEEEEEEDDWEEDESPRKRSKSKKKRTKTRKLDEEEEEEEDVDDDEDVEDEDEEDEEDEEENGRYRAEQCSEFGVGFDPRDENCIRCKREDRDGYLECKRRSQG